ncbi:xanthine dehydrogenase family protein molybdopterin-binding subunit [Antarcticibacterium flavum]|uniref:Xanthine dehydrogenase family protein molybdopterin-binding subunit n=1 Tax=Antarcticibacterium flavum TaxID=2058175 RepID=A0A5B7X612_9FLAO|nr:MULTISPECIES: molybdopterin cofactor-binding domain-containing protein [Antarcticibacterium]MCM4158402.1 xanthine dehydrogenase family protein molybdopterin-binding subunit [Antarcticibacterium sp. W02-3]QCY70162.1 xanthine dehydrogenase family protein molybdopterin-binding subunit [Antarcticibacterium flavum]
MKTSRRNFIKTTGYVAVGISVVPGLAWAITEDCEAFPEDVNLDNLISDWVQILEDGQVRIYTGKMELGQGIRIAIAQVAAEELNMDIDLVEVHLAETGVTPNEGYTAGSNSIARSAMTIRRATAAASAILLDRAAQKYDLKREDLYLKDGMVFTGVTGQAYSLADILEGEHIEEVLPEVVLVKGKKDHVIVGQPVLREDISIMARGNSVYVQDMRFKGMLFARVLRPLAYDAHLTEFNKERAEALEDVVRVIRKNNFIGVLAKDEYQAEEALKLLADDCTWEIKKKLPAGKDLKEYLPGLTTQYESVVKQGSVNFGNDSIKSCYFKPYIMHGSIGPSCAVGYYNEDVLHIWTHSQGVYPLRAALSDLTGLPEEKILVKGVPGSGCYGHNGADDVAAEVALFAIEHPNTHIKLQWTREEEHAWEPFGSAMIMELQGELDASGMIFKWNYELWSDTHSTRPGGKKENLLPTIYYEGTEKVKLSGFLGGGYRNSQPYYRIPNLQVEANFFDGPLRVSALRSLGAYANIFAIESFMDELAEKAGRDPVEFRLAHLDDPRARDVLVRVREMASSTRLKENQGIGYAFSRYKNSASYFAVAAITELVEGEMKVRKMWGAIDSGEIINPDGLKNQTEGGMIQSASWTMMEEVKFNEDHVESVDWGSYPIFRFEDIPEVEVAVIDRPNEEPLGAGEAAQGPAAAAIVNAIYNATGKRVRDLPVNKNF